MSREWGFNFGAGRQETSNRVSVLLLVERKGGLSGRESDQRGFFGMKIPDMALPLSLFLSLVLSICSWSQLEQPRWLPGHFPTQSPTARVVANCTSVLRFVGLTRPDSAVRESSVQSNGPCPEAT